MKVQLFQGAAKPTPKRLQPVGGNTWPCKPKGGMWTSTYDPKIGSAWLEWCMDEDFISPPFRCWLLYPKDDARILTINRYADLGRLMQKYRAKPQYPFDATIDFEALARDFDGMHITDKGQRETRLTLPYNLYGWDCESTLWFRWAFSRVTDLGYLFTKEKRMVTGNADV